MPKFRRIEHRDFRGWHRFNAARPGKKPMQYRTKPGHVVEAEEYEIGYAWLKYYELVDEPPVRVEDDDSPALVLKAVHKGAGKYNVINVETGHPINDELLSKEEANHLVEVGEGESIDEDDDKICPDCLELLDECVCDEEEVD